MSLYCSINIFVRLLTAGWYVVIKGKILPLACFFSFKADGLEANKMPSYHQIHGQNIRERYYFPRQSGV